MINPTEASTIWASSLRQQVDTSSPAQYTYPQLGSVCSLLFFRLSSGSEQGQCCEGWSKGRSLAARWDLPACLLSFLSMPQNLGFILGDLGQVLTSLWAQQADYQLQGQSDLSPHRPWHSGGHLVLRLLLHHGCLTAGKASDQLAYINFEE